MVPKNNIVILFFHPAAHRSRVNMELLQAARPLEGVAIREMYEIYPDAHIDVQAEQEILLRHDIIIWQHPFYWYSSPSLLKEWLDLVLQHGFAYGKSGRALEGKSVMSAITTGGRRETYGSGGGVKYSIRQLLAPFEQTVQLCRMAYLPPFVTHGTHLLKTDEISEAARDYARVLSGLRDGAFQDAAGLKSEYITDLI